MMLFETVYLNWVILGVVLLIIEVASFTLLFFWLAIAALLVAAVTFIAPDLSLAGQLFTYAGLSAAAMVGWYFLFKDKQRSLGNKKMNNRAARYIGQTAQLIEPVENSFGKIKIEDSLWRVQCNSPLNIGERVTIVAVDGVILLVEPT